MFRYHLPISSERHIYYPDSDKILFESIPSNGCVMSIEGSRVIRERQNYFRIWYHPFRGAMIYSGVDLYQLVDRHNDS